MSLFYITVPTRDYEVTLRHKELDVKEVRLTDHEHAKLSIVNDKNSTAGTSSGGGSARISLVHSGGKDIYTAVAGGKEAEIVLGDDFMEVKHVHHPHDRDHDPNKHRDTIKSTVIFNEEDDDDKIEMEISKYFLEKHLEDALDKFELNTSATWNVSLGGKISQVSFTVPSNFSEVVIQRLSSVGIGTKYGSTLTVCSAEVYYGPRKYLSENETKDKDSREETGTEDDSKKSGGWHEFVQSIKSRLTVAQVVATVQANAIITFDFLALVSVAGLIACLGLLENSSVMLVASMLISPLMGPIMALTFGAMIRDTKLIKIGFKSEATGLLICLLVGFFSGIFLEAQAFKGIWDKVTAWPTPEMEGRGQWRGIIVGIMMAIPSGIGVALSILAGNAGSLVGVAIAASLLPPAVNCGLFWGLSLVLWFKSGTRYKIWNPQCHKVLSNSSQLADVYFVGYKLRYCKNAVGEFAILGSVSFCLTLVNIFIIFIVAILILKIKEVAPYTTRKALRRFWKEDLAVTRQYNVSHETHDIEGIMNDINNAENSEEIKRNLDQDLVIRQVNRRMGGAVGPSIVNDMRQNQRDAAEADKPKKTKSTKSITSKQESGRGWFSSWFRSKAISSETKSKKDAT